jgi:hypothetical protein
MRKLLVVSLFSVALCNYALACGTERWAVKVLTDDDRHLIDRTPQVMSVGDLAALDSPSDQDRRSDEASEHRIADPEKTTYKVTAILLGYRHEKDGDFHLVLQDPNSDATIIAEIPDPACVDDSDLADQLTSFRESLVAKFGSPGKKTVRLDDPPTIVIRGVGFFDIKHSTDQDGVAPNNFELHPVLGLSLGS